MGPSRPKKLGRVKGVTRLTRNIRSGWALSPNIKGPPCEGPHHRLWFPYESCQSERFKATYVSKNRPWLNAEVGVSGGTGNGEEMPLMRLKSAWDMALRAVNGRAGAEGEC